MKTRLVKHIWSEIARWPRKISAWHDRHIPSFSARGVIFSAVLILITAIAVQFWKLDGNVGQIVGNALGIVAAVLAAQWVSELNQKQNAKNVAAPIRDELLLYHELAIKEWRNNLSCLEALNNGVDPHSRASFTKLPRAQRDAFDSLRSRLGELGAYVAHEVTKLYTYLPNGDELPYEKLTFSRNVCENQRQNLLKIEKVIDLLFALERTGETDFESLDEEAKSSPAQLSDRTDYRQKN